MGRIIAVIPTDHYGAVNLGTNITNMVSIAEEDKEYVNNYFKINYGHGIGIVMSKVNCEVDQTHQNDLIVVPVDDLGNENVPVYAVGTISEEDTYEKDLQIVNLPIAGWVDITERFTRFSYGFWDGSQWVSEHTTIGSERIYLRYTGESLENSTKLRAVFSSVDSMAWSWPGTLYLDIIDPYPYSLYEWETEWLNQGMIFDCFQFSNTFYVSKIEAFIG